MELQNSCFCHPQFISSANFDGANNLLGSSLAPVCSPPTQDKDKVDMDLDSALNELGMLSSVCDGKQQYLVERRKKEKPSGLRERKLSEPASLVAQSQHKTTSLSKPDSTSTPNNSPTKASPYQVVQLNPKFVTHFSTALSGSDSPGQSKKYSPDNWEMDASSRSLTKIRLTRSKRFKKPYEMPWLQRHSIDTCYPSSVLGNNQLTNDDKPLQKLSPSLSDINICSRPVSASISLFDRVGETSSSLFDRVDKTQRINDRNDLAKTSNSDSLHCNGDGNGNHCPHAIQGHVSRSKSLDELDFANLKVAEYETKNLIQERKEIDNMSNYLQNLHVNE